ncbi:alpha/beta hydrolase [Xylophilus ampelinus]|uniref:Esterase/lipase n=1 Tax=Xylophilus ampelinus TaxID=54067 RepID=A0A318SGK1_9BURK|nr:alpha/beta fold hydrolase [Xylophilus ampelinus]MCS4510497.1 alpha/beta fold hydrolase [Xylophilus ampelinus]PYE77953.1 esterase/lipase [Xylophilus ampelinus]
MSVPYPPPTAAMIEPLCVTPHEFLLEGRGANARTGVLLVHGLTGTPNEMRVLAKGLHKQGFTVYAVQLAGHCGTQDDLLSTRWQDWYASVEAGADRLLPHVDRLVAGGLSMGAVLSLALAQRRPQQIAGVCALSTIFRYDGWSMPFYTRLGFLLPLLKALGIGRHRLFMEQPPFGIKDEALRGRVVSQMRSGDSAAAGLPGNPWWSIIEMRRLSAHVLQRLRDVRAPCLVIHAREDDVSTPSNAEDIVRGVTHAPVELVMLDNSYHMITIDRDRRTVIARTADFVQRIAQGDVGARATPAGPAPLQKAPARG